MTPARDASSFVCHCFGYTARDIEEDIARHGRSTILTRILDAKKHGTCDCARKNPSGK